MNKIIEAKNITKIYNKNGSIIVKALQNVSLSIEKGEFAVIMGASGSGKSTLMNILGCLDKPTTGKLFLDGSEVSLLDNESLAILRNQKSVLSFSRLICLTALRRWRMWNFRLYIPTETILKGLPGKRWKK